MKKSEDDLGLVEKGRERQTGTLRTRVYSALVAMMLVSAAPGLFFADSGIEVWSILGVMLVAGVAGIWVSEYLMMPLYSLRRRLEVKNYGEDSGESRLDPDLDLSSSGFELGALLFSGSSRRGVDMNASLPVELAAIEHLARAGRVSEMAMESVKRDLFRHLSHQLKSPLAMVRAHSQAATHSLSSSDIESAAGSLRAIEALSLNTSGLVETMLSLAWVEGLEEQGLGRQKANLSSAIMELVSLREFAAKEKQMRIETNVSAGLWVRGHRRLLQEMFACLVDNAIRYGAASTAITVDASRLPSSKAVVVTITDRGPGIPPQERERVFEPFYGSVGLDERGNMTYGTRRHRALGSGVEKSSHGLGLALVRAVSKLHGASVALESGPGGIGLCVRVLLSATEAPAEGEEGSSGG